MAKKTTAAARRGPAHRGEALGPHGWLQRGGEMVPRAECLTAGGFRKGPMSPAGFRALVESMMTERDGGEIAG